MRRYYKIQSTAIQNGSSVRHQGTAVAIVKIGAKSAIDILKTALGDDDPNVQKAAQWALKKLWE